MEIPTRLPRGNFPSRSNRIRYDDTSSSSDSSSSPPRKRSWKKLHRRKTSLVLGRQNYLQPTQCFGEAIKRTPQSVPGPTNPVTTNTTACNQDVCKEKSPIPPASRNEVSIRLKETPPIEIDSGLSQNRPFVPAERCKGKVEDLAEPRVHQKSKKPLLNGRNVSKLLCVDPNLGPKKNDADPQNVRFQSKSRQEFQPIFPRERNDAPVLVGVDHTAGSGQLGRITKETDVAHLLAPTVVKNGLKRQFVDSVGLVVLLRNDQGTINSTPCTGNHLGVGGGFRIGSEQISNQSSSLFDMTEQSDRNISSNTISPPRFVSVTCNPLPFISPNDCRLNAAKNITEREPPTTNLDTLNVGEESRGNIVNGTRRADKDSSRFLSQKAATNLKTPVPSVSIRGNSVNRIEEDLAGAGTRLDAPESLEVEGPRTEVVQPDVPEEAHPNNDNTLQMLINRFSLEDSPPEPKLDSLNIVNFGSLNVEQYCKLSFCKPFRLKCLRHAQRCNLVAEGFALRNNCDTLWQRIPGMDRSTLHIFLGSICQEYILENKCANKKCQKKHTVELDFKVLKNDASFFKMFLKWYDANSKTSNFKILNCLLTILSVGFCNENEWLSLLLSFSRFILKLQKDFQHPLALLVLNKMTTLLRVPYHEAARLILVFTVTHTAETATVQDLFSALGALDMNDSNLLMLLSSVWHLNSNVKFPGVFTRRILSECLKNIPKQFNLIRDKIVLQIMDLPRKEILGNFPNIERFLMKFFPTNSKLVFYFRDAKIRGDKVDYDNRIAWVDNYRSSRVKLDDINPSWQYWDVGENRRNGFLTVVGNRTCEYPSDPLMPSRSEDLALTELEDDVEADQIALWTRLDTLPETERAIQDLHMIEGTGRYETFIKTLASLGHFYNKNLLDFTLNSLSDMFVDMDTELPSAIDRILKALPQPSPHSNGPRRLRKAFVSSVNALVVKFYQQRKFEYAFVLIKTMQASGENPFRHKPPNMDQSLFEIVCSHIHLECFMVKDAVQILLHSKCLDSSSSTFADSPFIEHFRLLEMLVFKLLKHCLAARQSLYALNVFRGVVKAQKSLSFPMNIHRYYEPVLCSTFSTNVRASTFLCHEGANLYVLVDRLCGNATKFHPMTYRSILVALYDANVSEDIVRRTLQCCIRANAYPPFKSDYILLSCNLTTEEMYLYMRHYVQFFLSQTQFETVNSRPLPIRLTPVDEPLNSPFVITERISVVSKELPDCVDRLKKALELLSGVVFSELKAEMKSHREFVLPEVTVQLLFRTVQGQIAPID